MYDKTTMEMISGHYKTGQTLPEEIFQQVCKGNKNRVKQAQRRTFFCSVPFEKALGQELRKRILWVGQGYRRGQRVHLRQMRLSSLLREKHVERF